MAQVFSIYQEPKEKLDRILDWELQDRYILSTKEEVCAFLREKGILLDILPANSEKENLTSFCDAPSLTFEGFQLKFLSVKEEFWNQEENFLKVALYEYACYLIHRRYFEYMTFPMAQEAPTFQTPEEHVGYRYATEKREYEYLHKTTASTFAQDKAACYLVGRFCGKTITKEDFQSLQESKEQDTPNIVPIVRK